MGDFLTILILFKEIHPDSETVALFLLRIPRAAWNFSVTFAVCTLARVREWEMPLPFSLTLAQTRGTG
jgi:hypothetical protein